MRFQHWRFLANRSFESVGRPAHRLGQHQLGLGQHQLGHGRGVYWRKPKRIDEANGRLQPERRTREVFCWLLGRWTRMQRISVQ